MLSDWTFEVADLVLRQFGNLDLGHLIRTNADHLND